MLGLAPEFGMLGVLPRQYATSRGAGIIRTPGTFPGGTGMNILHAMQDARLFRQWFEDPRSWKAQRVVLKAIFGIPLARGEKELYHALTGRRTSPTRQAFEAWLLAGRRSAKTLLAALIVTFIAAFRDHQRHLQPGEQAACLLLAVDRQQATVAMRYIKSFFAEIPVLQDMIVRETADTLELNNGAIIQVATNSFRLVRGRTVAVAVFDEVCFWRDEASATPDVETYRAVVPALATMPNALLIGISSPYRQAGLMYQKWKRHYGVDGDNVLVFQADTLTMNPTVPKSIIDAAYESDPASASAEWGAQWRADLELFLSPEVLEQVVVPERLELPPVNGIRYYAFTDPAGGSGGDSFTLAVGHNEAGTVVIDALRERRPPFSPESTIREYADLLKTYGLHVVTGDKYAGGFPPEIFRKFGITYRPSPLTKSDLYKETLSIFNTGKLELLDHKKLLTQFANLERRTTRGGKDSIDHPKGGHDDISNAVAGAIYLSRKKRQGVKASDFVFSQAGAVSITEGEIPPLAELDYPGLTENDYF